MDIVNCFLVVFEGYSRVEMIFGFVSFVKYLWLSVLDLIKVFLFFFLRFKEYCGKESRKKKIEDIGELWNIILYMWYGYCNFEYILVEVIVLDLYK